MRVRGRVMGVWYGIWVVGYRWMYRDISKGMGWRYVIWLLYGFRVCRGIHGYMDI